VTAARKPPRDARRARGAGGPGARRTRKNLFADGALAVASGATLLIVLSILVMILFDVIRNGTPHLSWTFPRRRRQTA
jgi:hypothetical protein